MLTAIIIDDEMHAIDTLSILLSKYCPDVQVVDKCMSAEKALKSIVKLNPDVIFLDIEMPIMNGFELLEQFKEINFAIIFTTSYDGVEGTDFPEDDGSYAWRWLVYHFAKGGRLREARALLTNGTYLKTKIAQYGTSAVLQDFAALPPDDPLQQIAGALRLGAQILIR